MADDLPEVLLLTKRELFAAMILQGLAARPGLYPGLSDVGRAVSLADDLLAELAKGPR